MGTLTHALGDHCDWQITALTRSSLALLLVAGWMGVAGVRPVVLRPPTLWLRSLAGSMSLICNFYALARLPVADVLALTNLFPIWVALLSWPLERRAPTLGVWISVAAGLAGVILIQPPERNVETFAALVAVAASFFTAVAMMGLHRLQGLDPRAIVGHFSAVSIVFCIGSLFVFKRDPALPGIGDPQTWAMLLGVGATATIGQLFLTKAFAAGPPAKVAVVGLSQVVFAMVLEVALLKHTYPPTSLAGIALVIAPTAWLMVNRVGLVDYLVRGWDDLTTAVAPNAQQPAKERAPEDAAKPAADQHRPTLYHCSVRLGHTGEDQPAVEQK
jgi:drug/metabolite transporter (DMT)-like permease